MAYIYIYVLSTIFILSLVCSCSPFALPDQVFPIDVPTGVNVTSHNSDNLFCVVPAPWSTLIVFYLGNYAAHAATLITYPGEAPISILVVILSALFYPNIGIARGLNAIFRHANFPCKRTDLQIATRAGALCMVVRTPAWRPKERNGSETPAQQQEKVAHQEEPRVVWKAIEGAWSKELPRLWPYFETSLARPGPQGPHDWQRSKRHYMAQLLKRITNTERKINGNCILPKNGFYALAYVPRNAKVVDCHPITGITTTLSSSHSAMRAAIAIAQILYTSTTLYKIIKGPQVNQYGFTAFGLTASPYLIMSLFNLVGNIMTPNYDSLYIVHSPILQEAIDDYDAVIDGMVGALVMKEDKQQVAHIEGNVKVMLDMVEPQKQERRTSLCTNKEDPLAQIEERRMETLLCTNKVSTFCAGTVEHRVFFSCPVIERTDKIPSEIVLKIRKMAESKITNFRSNFKKENRANIYVPWYSYLFFTIIYLFVNSLSLLPIGIMSRFRKDNSTNGQQAWILSWMIVGVIIGPIAGLWDSFLDFKTKTGKSLGKAGKATALLLALVFIAPGIGGFVVVGRMLREYGDCVNLF